MRPNRLRQKFAAGQTAYNCWITLPGTLAAEMLAHQGWDSLTVDLQHGHSDFAMMCAMFAAISTTDTMPMMRVPWNDPADVMRALDAGAYGVICPNIDTPEDCARFVGACHYPPDGYRSIGPKRGLLYGGPDYLARANETILTIVQIESRKGMENLDAIAAVPGVDMLYIGPSDLAAALGCEPRQNPTDPIVLDAISAIVAGAKRAGKFAAMHCADAAYAKTMMGKGFDLITVTSDENLLSRGKAERASLG